MGELSMFGARNRGQELGEFGDIRRSLKRSQHRSFKARAYNLARGFAIGAQSASTTATDVCRSRRHRSRGNGCGVWSGLRRVSDSGGRQLECLWLGHGESLHRGAGEKREDDLNVRPTAGLDLRACAVSARGVAALLVLEPAS